jgi:hypothetical protein
MLSRDLRWAVSAPRGRILNCAARNMVTTELNVGRQGRAQNSKCVLRHRECQGAARDPPQACWCLKIHPVGPFPRNQLAVPSENGVRRDEPREVHVTRIPSQFSDTTGSLIRIATRRWSAQWGARRLVAAEHLRVIPGELGKRSRGSAKDPLHCVMDGGRRSSSPLVFRESE